MNRHRFRSSLAALLLLAFATACASVGTSDPTLVRAEDLLSNSLSVYDGAMKYHFANSTREPPEVYAVFERVRTGFPTAWQGLYDGTREYKRVPDRAKLDSAIAAVRVLLDAVAPLIGGQ